MGIFVMLKDQCCTERDAAWMLGNFQASLDRFYRCFLKYDIVHFLENWGKEHSNS